MFHISRWKRSALASNVTLSALALSAALALPAAGGGQDHHRGDAFRSARHRSRIITTAYITRDHGYMVYDTLLATDSNFKIQPQMADWKVSDDKLTYTFTLRDGLKWHDGAPVTAEDCVASLKRWGKQRRHGPEADGLHRQHRGHRRQDHHAEAEGALRPGAGIDRQAVVAGAVHDAEAAGGNAGRQADHGADRLRSVQVRAGRIPARREGGLSRRTRTMCRARSRRAGPPAARW